MRIFRKIRQQQLTINQTSRYFLFATGEIALIIIGVLIALYIDNRKEEKYNLGLEKEYLLSMKKELANDSENLLRFTDNLNNVIGGFDIILDNNNTHSKLPSDSIARLYRRMFYVPQFRSHTETFESIESSGHLSLIQNLTIKHNFFQLINEYEAFEKFYIHQFLSIVVEITKNSTKYFAFDKMNFIDNNYPYSQDAINNIMMSKLVRASTIDLANVCHQTVIELLENIESELETRFSQ